MQRIKEIEKTLLQKYLPLEWFILSNVIFLAMLKLQLTTCWRNYTIESCPDTPERRFEANRCRGNLIREFMTRARSRTRLDGEIMKAHCRIKKSVELTARAGATCSTVCLPVRLASQARIPPLYRMPPGFNELNYTSLRVIREVDDRDTDEVWIRTTGVSQSSSRFPLSFFSSPPSFSRSFSFYISLFSTKTTPRLIIVVNMLL